jgi:hypothetical protein
VLPYSSYSKVMDAATISCSGRLSYLCIGASPFPCKSSWGCSTSLNTVTVQDFFEMELYMIRYVFGSCTCSPFPPREPNKLP